MTERKLREVRVREDLPAIDPARLRGMFDDLSAFGGTPGGGVTRLAASREDGIARDYLRDWLDREGFRVHIDQVGNIYGLLDLAGAGAPLILTGSHLDSQPLGGRFDGAYGVVASCEAVRSVRAFGEARSRPFSRNLGIAAWTNEEGTRFQPSTLGSSVFAGLYETAAALSQADRDGVTLEQALAGIGYLGTDDPPSRVESYLELHIEQGRRLEDGGCAIGVVEGNWGTVKYVADIQGEAAHTGPTPMKERRDALLAAAQLIILCRTLSDETDGELVTSVGRLDITPNSTNIVAGHVRVFAEFRALDSARLADGCRRFEGAAARASSPGLSIGLRRTTERAPGSFDSALCSLVEAVARIRGYRTMRLHTVAGHDAVPLRAVCRSGMIFVPSVNGVSHSEKELTRPEDMEAGATVLAGALYSLATGTDGL